MLALPRPPLAVRAPSVGLAEMGGIRRCSRSATVLRYHLAS